MMKTKPILPILLALCFAVSCKKEDPPIPPTEPVVKYLSKVWYVNADSMYAIAESCTWDSLYRLKTFHTQLHGSLNECSFHYDSLSHISKIDCYDCLYGYGYYLCYWKNDNELDSLNYYSSGNTNPTDTIIYFLTLRYAYSYENNRCVKIIKRHIHQPNPDELIILEWDRNNIVKYYEKNAYDSTFYINSPLYDNKYNPKSAFPKIPIHHISRYIFNPSQNNSLAFVSKYYNVYYEYEYDEDNYPIRLYQIENEKKELMFAYEYE